MSFINTSFELIRKSEEYVDMNWVSPKKASFVEKHILARGAYFSLAPAAYLTHAVNTIYGIGIGIKGICTQNQHSLLTANNSLQSSRYIIAKPFFNLLKTVNPNAKLSTYNRKNDSKFFISSYGSGFISHFVQKFLRGVASDCLYSENKLIRKVGSRLTYALLGIASLVTRAADMVIGVIAAGLTFLTFGKVESLNNLAHRALQAPAIMNDLFYCTNKFINPRCLI